MMRYTASGPVAELKVEHLLLLGVSGCFRVVLGSNGCSLPVRSTVNLFLAHGVLIDLLSLRPNLNDDLPLFY